MSRSTTTRCNDRRNDRRGGILAMAMLFFVMVTVAGTAILSMSSIQKIRTVRNGVDVRLMIAAEGAIETLRGRFTLIQGVQDNWNWISDTTWTSLGVINVNGIAVDVEGLRDGGASVPRARLRARATASGVTRVVEITIRIASFSDYSVFGSGGNLGQDYKLVGNMYALGNVNVPYTGARVYGSSVLTGNVTGAYAAVGNPEYPFVNENAQELQPAIMFPTNVAQWDYMKTIAETTGYVFAENTLEIVLTGTTFTRYYLRRKDTPTAGSGTIPASNITNTAASWIAPTTGVTNYASAYLNNVDYELAVEANLPIPDEGVIYIQSGAPSGIVTPGPFQVSGASDNLAVGLPLRSNDFTQQYNHTNDTAATTGISPDYYVFSDLGGFGVPNGPADLMLLSGTLDDRRVTIVCDHRIIVKQCIAYQGNLDNPDNRRFFNDGLTGKQGPLATNMKEMLGVMSRTEIHPTLTWWTPLPAASRVIGDLAGETVPGHNWGDTNDASNGGGDYCMDGVYLAINRTAPTRNFGYASGTGPLGEMWMCGGLIAQGGYGGGFGNSFYRRGYDWDYRMAVTMPPYFLRAYNVTARFVPGTWRSWEE